MKFKYEELKLALLKRVHPKPDPETWNWKAIELTNFDKKCIRMRTNKVQLSIKLLVKEVQTDSQFDTLHGTGEDGKQNEYVIVDVNRGSHNCLYVVQQFNKTHGRTSHPFFLCYDATGIGERKQRWPEIPVSPDNESPPRVYSIDCELVNRPKTDYL